eukprot:scaffold1918_cov154-Amphora_coffeaeformis.AAC.20
MNISLSAAAVSKKKKKASTQSIGFGLNQRGARKTTSNNVFGEESSEEGEKEEAAPAVVDARAAVNQALRKEQEALRQRAQKELQAQSALYDFDGDDDDDDTSKPQQPDDTDKPPAERKSRYISQLLQTAAERKLDRDIAIERKVAREQQQEEEENVELRGKERFVTAAYKRKLEERKLWQDEQDKRAKQEEDVIQTKQGMANFYGNLNQNVSMGGAKAKESSEQGGATGSAFSKYDPNHNHANNGEHARSQSPLVGRNEEKNAAFLDGFEAANDSKGETDENTNAQHHEGDDDMPGYKEQSYQSNDNNPEAQRQERRRKREERVAQARIRYMQRHGLIITEDTS